tara:strand:+ start:207 stop:434 length:228 start_codon:yes stop_codon:yes gene_type:complete
MGKRRAVKLATVKISNDIIEDLQSEVVSLNQMADNLQILLRRETEKNAVLEEKLKNLSKSKDKKSPKKSTVKEEE